MRPVAITQRQIDNGVLVRLKKDLGEAFSKGTIGLLVGRENRSLLKVQLESDAVNLTEPLLVYWNEIELVG